MSLQNDLASLCSACGACCGGVVFSYVALLPDEVSRVRRHLPVIGESPTLELPCPGHTGAGCGLYESRPQDCRNYRCDMHRAVEADPGLLAEAIVRAARIRDLASSIRNRLAAAGSPLSLLQILRAADLDPRGLARTEPELLLDLVELGMRLKRDVGVGDPQTRKRQLGIR